MTVKKNYRYFDIASGTTAIIIKRANGTAVLKTQYETKNEVQTVFTNYENTTAAYKAWETVKRTMTA